MSKRSWSINLETIPSEGIVIMVKEDKGSPTSALFLRVKSNTNIEKSEPLEDGTNILAYLNVCPHMKCRLIRKKYTDLKEYKPSSTAIVGPCACHGTRFDLLKKGLVVLGPSTRSLLNLLVHRDKDVIRATLDSDEDLLLEN